MTIKEYQEKASRTFPKNKTKDDLLLNAALGLAGESGEFADSLKKHFFQGHPLNKIHDAYELGDICWYIALAAKGLDIPLEEIFKMNIEKLEKRYPDGFSVEKSVGRTE